MENHVHMWQVSPQLSWWRHQMETFRVTGHLCGEFTGPGEFVPIMTSMQWCCGDPCKIWLSLNGSNRYVCFINTVNREIDERSFCNPHLQAVFSTIMLSCNILTHRFMRFFDELRPESLQNPMMSALLAICAGNSPVPGEFPAQRPVARSFDVFFDLRVNKRLSKQSWGWWFETLARPLWPHRNALFWRNVCWILLIWFMCGSWLIGVIMMASWNGNIFGGFWHNELHRKTNMLFIQIPKYYAWHKIICANKKCFPCFP